MGHQLKQHFPAGYLCFPPLEAQYNHLYLIQKRREYNTFGMGKKQEKQRLGASKSLDIWIAKLPKQFIGHNIFRIT